MLINGIPDDKISVEDRGLLYGDGIFETILCQQGIPVLFDGHMQRFTLGCKQLSLPVQNIQLIYDEILKVAKGEDCVVKLMLTRGVRGRGYYYDAQEEIFSRILYSSPLPAAKQGIINDGAKLMICNHRLASSEKLAGIKHLNRLDQVIARSEWSTEYNEGVVLDQQGFVIEATMSNLFVLLEDSWVTPEIKHCGVQGVLRDFLLEHSSELSITMREGQIKLDELEHARAMFVCNSVMGIWPVQSIDAPAFTTQTFAEYEPIRKLMAYVYENLSSLYPV